MGAERDRVAGFGRLENGLRQASDWYLWGPYVSERQWGTVREDYSADGEAWDYLPHDHARSRAYRWGEDGLAGFCDVEQRLCLGLALWNGRDPILKERAFGLTGAEGNHGEDVKEYWWYLDAVPSHAWNRWRYHYPQAAFPYEDLRRRERPARQARAGVQTARHGCVRPGPLLDRRGRLRQGRPDRRADDGPDDQRRPDTDDRPRAADGVVPQHLVVGRRARPSPSLAAAGEFGGQGRAPVPRFARAAGGPGPGRRGARPLFCENETNVGAAVRRGAGDALPQGRHQRPRDRRRGHRQPRPARHQVRALVPADGRAGRDRRTAAAAAPGRGGERDGRDSAGGRARQRVRRVVAQRRAEADEFYAELTPATASADEAMVMRQAFAGLLWSKQLYNYDVARWLDGDPTQPPPPPGSGVTGRNSRWRNFDAFDIMSMPDKWEYPWFAAWDLAFHCVALAHVDPAFAKYQLILLCREWFQHPNGALPAYEWDFGDVNPPVQAWAALEVFAIDGGRDLDFLSRVFDKLLVNFTWWVNLEDADGNNVFEGGFLGLDNIGPIDRSHLPVGGILEQSDATGWMAFYAIAMAAIAGVLHRSGQRPASDLVDQVPRALRRHQRRHGRPGAVGRGRRALLRPAAHPGRDRGAGQGPVDGGHHPRAGGRGDRRGICSEALTVGKQFADLLRRQGLDDPASCARPGCCAASPATQRLLLSVVGADRLERIFARLFDEGEFLSPYGLRALSAYHRDHPYGLDVEGVRATIDYEPAESTTPCSAATPTGAGRSGSRSTTCSSACSSATTGSSVTSSTIEYPTGSGHQVPLDLIAAGPAGPAHLAVRGRPGRPPSLLRRRRPPAARPGLEGQPGVQRVLPRRQRGRAGRRRTRRAGPG